MDEDTLCRGLRQLKAPDTSVDFNTSITRALAQSQQQQLSPRSSLVRNMIAMSASFAAMLALLQYVSAGSAHYRAGAVYRPLPGTYQMLESQQWIDSGGNIDLPPSAWSSGVIHMGQERYDADGSLSHGV